MANGAEQKPKKKRGYLATVPPQEILPIIDGNFQSSVRGIYVIGDVTGVPLVKIAANHGVEAIERMEKKGAFQRGPSDNGHLDLAIVGGGPAGLSAAMEAERRNLKYVVLERSHAANTVRGFPPGKKVYSEPRHLTNRSELPVEGDREKSEFLSMVDEAIKEKNLKIKEGAEVKQIRKRGENDFEVHVVDGQPFPARNVVIAIGRQGEARKLEIPGEDKAHKVVYRLHTPDDYHGNDVLIAGGGNSAIEAALMLMDDNRVTLSYRRDEFFRLKSDNREALERAMAENKLTVLLESTVQEIRDDQADLLVQGEPQTIQNDYVLVLIGTLPPVEFLLDTGLELDGVWTLKRGIYCLIGILIGYFVYFQAKHFTLTPQPQGSDLIHIPGFTWMFEALPTRFANLYSFYYLLYFVGIAGFGLYWGYRYKNRLVWRRNLSNIFFNWTLWWGLPTLLVVLLGKNPWTPLLTRSLNAWPLNMTAFDLDPIAGQGEPPWWTVVAIFGVVWAVILTFVILPVFTFFFGKFYCSHVCSCGALAETVGSAFRHRGPKGDTARWIERFGYVVIPLALIVTALHLYGIELPFGYYNSLVGTFFAGALAIGVYPFLGQRVWCRFWCPLAFWMNFWGRWSRFKISSEPGKCIDCNICNQYCQMGIDIKSRALQGKPVTLKDSPCVGCSECVVRCPMEILHLGDLPANKPYAGGTDAGPNKTVLVSIHDSLDVPHVNDLALEEREAE
ncbi:MAG: NAD(P)-binding domain-containing protein [Pirellulales bacterium]|nr:NAD(P)-binding domain-containing protein [Pirellulales bacterium]